MERNIKKYTDTLHLNGEYDCKLSFTGTVKNLVTRYYDRDHIL